MGTEQFRAFFTLRILSRYAESRPWDHLSSRLYDSYRTSATTSAGTYE